MDIESLAVSKIREMLARCPHLQAIIESNDKTPFTDGHINLYKTPSWKKEDRIGLISVQVKGRSVPRTPKQRNSFSVTRTDLLGFQQEGGVLYFVVYVNKNGDSTPYYAVLTPFAIDHLLDQVPAKQASISVSLRPLPRGTDEIERIVHVALKGRNQNPSLGFDPILFQNMHSITVTTTSDLNWDAPVTLKPGDTDFVLEMMTSSGASVPLSGVLQIFPSDYVAHEIETTIRAGDFAYTRATARRISREKFELVLGGGLSIVFTNAPEKQFDIKVTPHSNFAERHRALGFVVALVDHEQFEVGGETLRLRPDDTLRPQIAEIRERAAFLQNLHDLFDLLGVDGAQIDLGEVTEVQFDNLRTLYNVFIRGEQMIMESDGPGWAIVDVGGIWTVMILVRPGDKPNRWRLIDPFDPDAPQSFRVRLEPEGEGDAQAVTAHDFVTAYEFIEEEKLPTLLNMRLETVTQAYEGITDSERVNSRATYFVLRLISAADKFLPRKEEFLRGAKRLNEWVIAREGEIPVYLINRWQIEWRNGTLSTHDRNAIRELKHTVVHTEERLALEVELACSLLLGDTDEADYLAERMPEERLRQMQEWPIWRLRD